jgi:uncharacterized protein
MDESIVWTTRGDNALTGTYTGKEEIGGLWAQLAGKGFGVAPKESLADGDRIVVLTTDTLAGESADSVDVLRFSSEGMLVSFETFGDASIVDRASRESLEVAERARVRLGAAGGQTAAADLPFADGKSPGSR